MSSEPDLFIDGMPCCDQYTAHAMAHHGGRRPDRPGLAGHRVPATLTHAGAATLAGGVAGRR